ncbi:MAG: YwbE family protein [Bacteroidia bacterium]|nr:YwbE family protein [Bacteroidia bacterium]
MDGTQRSHIKPGQLVHVILKRDQRSGKRTEGIVQRILTSAPHHSRGIKVMLEDGQVGRVQEILSESEQ